MCVYIYKGKNKLEINKFHISSKSEGSSIKFKEVFIAQ